MSLKRDEAILTIRPVISTIDQSKPSSVSESFQNRTLRPILKYQHEVIVTLFNQFKQSSYDSLSQADQRNRIKTLLQNNLQFRNQLIGVVIAMMTKDELHIYFTHESEMKKRVISMIVERLID